MKYGVFVCFSVLLDFRTGECISSVPDLTNIPFMVH